MFGFRNQPFNLAPEWPVLETKRLKIMKPLSEKSKEKLKKILTVEIGEEKIKLLDDNDIQEMGVFLLTILAEAYKRRLRDQSV